VYLLHCTIGHHGLFSLSPVWLLAVTGWVVVFLARPRHGTGAVSATLPASETSAPAAESTPVPFLVHGIGLALSLIVFGYFLTKTDHYNYGGVSVALRWLLWLTPFWLLALVPLLDALGGRWWLRGLAAGCLAVSVFSAWHPFDGPWKHPWLFTLMEDAGWIDYRDRRPEFSRPVHSWIDALPQGGQRHDDYWTELSAQDADGRELRLRLQDGGPAEVDGRAARRIDITWNTPGAESRAETYWIDVAAFAAGRPPANFILWPAGPPAEGERQTAIAFWHGVPRPARYTSLIDRYLKFPRLRRDAFRCRQAYARVRARLEGNREPFSFRRDVWFCDELPFGVAQFEDQVIDGTNTIATRQRWQVVATGRLNERSPLAQPEP
jgi:hypothetical protein